MTHAPHNPTPLPPQEDPLLTAYALGALPPHEAAQVEARLESDPAARAFVAEMRGFSLKLARDLVAEEQAEDFGLLPAQRRDLRRLIAKRAPSRMKFPRIAILCAIVAILMSMMLVMLFVMQIKKH